MGIEHIKAVTGYHETNGQVEPKLWELKPAGRNITHKRQNNWVNSWQDMDAYMNAEHSDTNNTSAKIIICVLSVPSIWRSGRSEL